MFEKLMKTARELHTRHNTEMVQEHDPDFVTFEQAINEAYDEGQLTAEQFDALALTAFVDFPDLKTDPENVEQMKRLAALMEQN